MYNFVVFQNNVLKNHWLHNNKKNTTFFLIATELFVQKIDLNQRHCLLHYGND